MMYCTIKAFLTTQDRTEQYLADVRDRFIDGFGEIHKQGKLRNLEIKMNGRGILLEGSLAKFYFGNNFNTLTLNESIEAIGQINELLHIDVLGANVYRVDVGTNIITNESPRNYYPCLIEVARLDRRPKGYSLYFDNNSKTLLYYDKTREAKSKRMFIPLEYRNKNVLRIEHRQLKFNRYKRTIGDLLKREIFNDLIDEWYKGYHSIKKVQTLQLTKEAESMFNFKAIEMEGLRFWIIQKFGSVESFFQFLDSEQNRGKINRQNKSDWKKKVERAFNQPDLVKPGSLIPELNVKVKEAADRYRC